MSLNLELLTILYQTDLPSRNPLEEFTPNHDTSEQVNVIVIHREEFSILVPQNCSLIVVSVDSSLD